MATFFTIAIIPFFVAAAFATKVVSQMGTSIYQATCRALETSSLCIYWIWYSVNIANYGIENTATTPRVSGWRIYLRLLSSLNSILWRRNPEYRIGEFYSRRFIWQFLLYSHNPSASPSAISSCSWKTSRFGGGFHSTHSPPLLSFPIICWHLMLFEFISPLRGLFHPHPIYHYFD